MLFYLMSSVVSAQVFGSSSLPMRKFFAPAHKTEGAEKKSVDLIASSDFSFYVRCATNNNSAV